MHSPKPQPQTDTPTQTPHRQTDSTEPSGTHADVPPRADDLTAAMGLDSGPQEAAVLGSMILDPGCIPEVLEVLPDEMWLLHKRHRLMWRLILRLHEANRGEGVDGLLVRTEVETDPAFGEDRVEYLRQLLESVPTAANACYYARQVRALAIRRNLLTAARQVASMADEPGEVADLVDRAQGVMERACTIAAIDKPVTTCMAALQSAFRQIEQADKPLVQMPFRDVADKLPGFTAGQMVVVAARPGHGKTALAMSLLARNFAVVEGFRALFISFEMVCAELMMRALSIVARVPFVDMARRQLDRDGFNRIIAQMQPGEMGGWDLLLADRLPPYPSHVRNLARKLHRDRPLNCIVVDYVQRMMWSADRPNRNDEMTRISNSLKNLALELAVPVIVISQLNRACDARPDHRPHLSDLRDSGSIEQDADVVLLLCRQDCYEPDSTKHKGDAEVEIAKQRNGPVGSATLAFLRPYMEFANAATLFGDEPQGEFGL